ncbi:MAG: tRNA adenosine(34) deaminase TadA [Selenomonadaceae bacterium]|nr:tRNA adenosine(34) deaminase TadA [Selenomonadaceae bacterium]
MLDDRAYMRQALAEAEKACARGEIPVGAVIVENDTGRILSAAHNEREASGDATAHAELLAIRRACACLGRWRLSGCTLYVTLEPCPMCAGAIVMARLDRVVYGAVDSRAGACESIFNIPGHPSLNHHPVMTAGVLDTACTEILHRFFRTKRSE